MLYIASHFLSFKASDGGLETFDVSSSLTSGEP